MKTDDSNYPDTLFLNGVVMDRSARKIAPDLKTYIEELVKRKRSSPPLKQEELDSVIEIAEEVADSSEGPVHRIFDTPMFPVNRAGIAAGGNTLFSTEPIPGNPDAPYEIAIPKPDRHYGYPTGQRSRFSYTQGSVIAHPFVNQFSRPTSDNAFPFLIVEETEAKGGTLWHAELQAAGGGTHMVNSIKWLLKQAQARQSSAMFKIDDRKTLAFSVCLTARQVLLYVHSYSSENRQFLMSCIGSYVPTQSQQIQDCNRHIKNIVDWALDTRRKDIETSLDILYPLPSTAPGKRKRLESIANSRSVTPATSLSVTVQTDGK